MASESDELIYEEKDTTFTLYMNKSQSGKFIIVHSDSKTTSEIRLIDADSPLSPVQLVDARRDGIKYDVEHWGDDLLILTNEGAVNFQLLRCPLDDLHSRVNVVEYNEDRYLQAMYPFQDALLVAGRENGLTQIWMLKNGELEQIKWDEPLYTVSVLSNQSYEATEVLLSFESLLTPETTYGLDPQTGEKHRLQVAPVSGDYDSFPLPAKAIVGDSRRRSQSAADPRLPRRCARSGACSDDPCLDMDLMERIVIRISVRTDSLFWKKELYLSQRKCVAVPKWDVDWYEDGKMQNKRNTFTDFIAAANLSD